MCSLPLPPPHLTKASVWTGGLWVCWCLRWWPAGPRLTSSPTILTWTQRSTSSRVSWREMFMSPLLREKQGTRVLMFMGHTFALHVLMGIYKQCHLSFTHSRPHSFTGSGGCQVPTGSSGTIRGSVSCSMGEPGIEHLTFWVLGPPSHAAPNILGTWGPRVCWHFPRSF